MNQYFWAAVRVAGFIISPMLAAGVTLGLFFFMQSLISSGERLEQNLVVVKLVDASMPEIELVLIEEIDKPEPIAEVAEQQPEIKDKKVDLHAGPALNIERAFVEMSEGLDLSFASISVSDGDYLPLVAIAAEYPTRARMNDIEGWCIVSFTVNGQGGVVEDSIEIVDSEPSNVFDRNSMRAASRFKFQPRTKNGIGVEVPGVQYLFRFEFED
jgi:periplasmic protein TonB